MPCCLCRQSTAASCLRPCFEIFALALHLFQLRVVFACRTTALLLFSSHVCCLAVALALPYALDLVSHVLLCCLRWANWGRFQGCGCAYVTAGPRCSHFQSHVLAWADFHRALSIVLWLGCVDSDLIPVGMRFLYAVYRVCRPCIEVCPDLVLHLSFLLLCTHLPYALDLPCVHSCRHRAC